MRSNKLLITFLGILLLFEAITIAYLVNSNQRQAAEFSNLQNQYSETKLELTRLKQVLCQSESNVEECSDL